MTSWASLSELVLVLKDPSWQVQLLLLGICAGLTIILYKRNNHAGTDHRVTNEAPSHLQDHEKSKENKVHASQSGENESSKGAHDFYQTFVDPDTVARARGKEDMLRRIKIARQKALNKQMTEHLDQSDLRMEKIIESQQLAKIFSLLQENEDKFGKVSIDDVKSQLSMYKDPET